MHIRQLLSLFLILAAFCMPACAETLTPEKKADIERLLDMTGALAVGKQMATALSVNMSQTLKSVRPDIPQNVIDTIPVEVARVMEANIGALKEAIIPIYHKHFTADEIKEMIRFYSSDLGRKTIKVMPALMQEGMLAGQRWGQSLGPKVEQGVRAKLRREGVNI